MPKCHDSEKQFLDCLPPDTNPDNRLLIGLPHNTLHLLTASLNYTRRPHALTCAGTMPALVTELGNVHLPAPIRETGEGGST